ncbi:MAG: prepilin-type N-terminal cleavage/methylation domain-containing protein [Deltaproteobacteria bacterium]|nr:prepilin-type N-terminal cleavage/methylation domain-containing protein [Deltaproteobacteria bacterium]
MATSVRGQAPAPRGRGGFTLVELLVTLAVAGFLIALIYQFFLAQQRSHTLQEDVADAQQSGRVALEELTRSLTSLGAGTDLEHGQVRILVAQPYQLVFNADLDPAKAALPPGTAVPGAGPGDPYPVIPAGTNAVSWTAETYRYTLDRNNDGAVTAADWQQGRHYTLFREKNGGANEEVASLVANPSVGRALFVYWGDFDGNGTLEPLTQVNAATSSRVAAGEALDAVIRRVEVHLVAQTASPGAGGAYRQVELSAAVSPENLWDCPLVTALDLPGPFPLPDLRGITTPIRFRVTRGGTPEPGRTVAFEGRDPTGALLTVTDPAGNARPVTDAAGIVTAVIQWPAGCTGLRPGPHTLRAWTEEPPTLSTPFGTCPSHAALVSIQVDPGPPVQVHFDDRLEVQSCGGTGGSDTVGFVFWDACDNPVLSVSDHQADLEVSPDPTFVGALTPIVLNTKQGTAHYESPAGDYSRFHVPRDPAAPYRYAARLRAVVPASNPPVVLGETELRVEQVPTALADLTANLNRTPFTDCPDPAVPVTETFAVRDECGNRIPTLSGTGASVTALFSPQPLPGWPAPGQGTIASPGNQVAFSTTPLSVVQHDGVDGEFAVSYQAPTCTVGAFTYRPQLSLTPSWPGAAPQTLSLTVGPCGGCSVQVVDAAGNPVTHLNRACDGRSDLVVTRCVPIGTTAEVVIGRVVGSGLLSLARNSPLDRATVTFNGSGAGQTARLSLFIGTARTGDVFRIAAFLPSQAAVQAGNGVLCQSEPLSVDTRCSEILVSAVPDNPQAVPAHLPADATPLCGAERTPVYFRVKDCDQNVHDNARDDIKNTAGTSRGLQVEVVDAGGAVLDREGPDLFEVDVHGNRLTDSPYFQGTLPLTHDPADASFSGRLRVPDDRVTTLRAQYVDPDDPSDNLSVAEALVIPPLPVCLAQPLLAGGDWAGPLRVHWGDAVVGGDLALPDPPNLVAKDAGAAVSAAPYGPGFEDRFFDAYVGGVISIGAAALPATLQPDQPFLAGGSGAAFALDRGNYLQAVPGVASLFARLDYDTLKTLALARRAYWEPESGGLLRNPATLQQGTFAEITRLPGPGRTSPTHDGTFLFVDAPPGLQSSSQLDQAPLASLPVYEVAGPWYSEGFLYVAGSVRFVSSSGAQAVGAQAPASLDARYDENRGGLSRADLPLDFAQPVTLAPAGALGVHLNGALYCDGEVRLPDGFRVYGAVAAERGGQAASTAEVWYDPRWRGARAELCSRCCRLGVSPSSPRVSTAGTLALAATGAQGAVVWESLAPQVAAVSQSGVVTPLAVGRAVIHLVDGAGCVAETEVEVF